MENQCFTKHLEEAKDTKKIKKWSKMDEHKTGPTAVEDSTCGVEMSKEQMNTNAIMEKVR